MDKEVTHIAVILVDGIAEDGNTESNGFASEEDAIDWVMRTVEKAHDDEVECNQSGNTVIVTSPNGPTKGWIFPA